jgi:hypothetical protein
VSLSTVTLLQPMFGEPGTYMVEFWHEEVRLTAINLHVVERQPPEPLPATRPN